MSRYPYNPNAGQEIQGDGLGIQQDMAFLARLHVAAAAATAAAADSIHAAVTLADGATTNVTTGITQPTTPRCLSIVGNVAADVQAALTSNMTNVDADLTLTAVPVGHLGNAISIEYIDPADVNQALGIVVTGNKITVNLATDGAGAITSTAALVKAAINADADALLLVAAEDENAGAGIGNAKAEASLTGGISKSGGNVVITGTDAANAALSETIALNGTTTVAGTKAFKTVTAILVPARKQAGDTVQVGATEKLGLGHKLSHNTVLKSYLNNVLEANAATVVVSATVLASNTVDLDSALDGLKDVDVYLMV